MRKNLKEARQKAGMTQQQMAEYLGINIRTYQRIENGEVETSVSKWDALEDLFKINHRVLRDQSETTLVAGSIPKGCEESESLPKDCENCGNFIQYYIKSGKRYTPICAGHCIAGYNVKDKESDDTCKCFWNRKVARQKTGMTQ